MGSCLGEPDVVVLGDVEEIADECLGLVVDLFELFAVGADVEEADAEA